MPELSNEILQKLAYQRGVLTLLQEREGRDPMIEKALEQLDYLMGRLI